MTFLLLPQIKHLRGYSYRRDKFSSVFSISCIFIKSVNSATYLRVTPNINENGSCVNTSLQLKCYFPPSVPVD